MDFFFFFESLSIDVSKIILDPVFYVVLQWCFFLLPIFKSQTDQVSYLGVFVPTRVG